jgi:flagellum-specific ATP synthase
VSLFDKYATVIERTEPIKHVGRVRRVQGLLIESLGPQAFVGELCHIQVGRNSTPAWAEVVGVRDERIYLMPYSETAGIEVGSRVIGTGEELQIPVSDRLLGRVLDGRGRPIDGKGDIGATDYYPAVSTPPDVLRRSTITEPIATGIRAIDGLVPAGKGQRLGVFSGSGVGKSTLIGMIARNTAADVNVIALIGERGREVRDFIEQDLGEEGLARSVLVVSTSDTPPLSRLRGAYVATAIAEYYRDQGKNVMLLFDSVTRFARAQREIGLANGETPATRGFPPSVFSILPKLLERSGSSEHGTITGFYSILVEGDDMEEPIADTVRGILDGHIVLTRKLAQRAHYPAIDVLSSVSRLNSRISSRSVQNAANYMRRLMATYTDAEDLINVGAYVKGTNAEIDEAIDKMPEINGFLQQQVAEKANLSDTRSRMLRIAGVSEETAQHGGGHSADQGGHGVRQPADQSGGQQAQHGRGQPAAQGRGGDVETGAETDEEQQNEVGNA